jgi:hypothetical protein
MPMTSGKPSERLANSLSEHLYVMKVVTPRTKHLVWLCATTTLVAGCAASSHVVTGNVRPPLSPEDVAIYSQPPPQYEEIGILQASSRGGFRFTEQGKMDKVIERLKIESAKLGANGVLLQSTQNRVSGSLGTGGGSTSYGGHSAVGVGGGLDIAIVSKEATAIAIYVPSR